MHTILNRLDRLMMAITFAEANEPQLAQDCLANRKPTARNRMHQTPEKTSSRIMANQIAHWT